MQLGRLDSPAVTGNPQMRDDHSCPRQCSLSGVCSCSIQLLTLKVWSRFDGRAVAIHGITTERAMDAGIDHAAGVARIRDALYDAWAAGSALCAFNATYDFTLLARECERYGLGQMEVRGPILDPYVIDKAVDRFRRGKRQLVDVAAHYGVQLSDDDAHGARADADAAAELARKLASNLQSPSKANAQQAKWYRDQRESFAQWLAGKGNKAEADEVLRRLEWPVKH